MKTRPRCTACRPTTPPKNPDNKMHDDTVARRFGFSGGLVPGVDVMAYMMHLPVAKWGRAFLERGLIEARFVKPVYDGEIADVSGAGARRAVVDSRSKAGASSVPPEARRCRHSAPLVFACGFPRNRCRQRAQTGGCGILLNRQVARHRAAHMGRRCGNANIWRIYAKPIRYMRERGWAIPACCSGS